MKRVLLLTENILVEESFQKKLNTLNLEVLTSATFIGELFYNRLSKKLLQHFQIAILSETISEAKADRVVDILKDTKINVVRKFDQLPNKELERKYTCEGQQNWIMNDATIEYVRERLSYSPATPPEYLNKKYLEMKEEAQKQKIRLTNREQRLLERLRLEEGETVTREDLCHFIWKDNKVTSSRLSALSSLVHNICRKYALFGFPQVIHTTWGTGYTCDDEFKDLLKNGKYLF